MPSSGLVHVVCCPFIWPCTRGVLSLHPALYTWCAFPWNIAFLYTWCAVPWNFAFYLSGVCVIGKSVWMFLFKFLAQLWWPLVFHSQVQARLCCCGGTGSNYRLEETFKAESLSHFGTDGTIIQTVTVVSCVEEYTVRDLQDSLTEEATSNQDHHTNYRRRVVMIFLRPSTWMSQFEQYNCCCWRSVIK